MLRAIILVMLMSICFTGTPAKAFNYPANGFPSRAACLDWMAEHPEFEPIFDNLPSVCLWHYVGWDCEQDWTPAGWLRPGGYCDQAKDHKSLVPTGKGEPQRKPCYHDNKYPV